MGTISSSRTISVPFYARISVPERIFSGFLTVIVRNANDGNETTDDFMTRYDDNFSNAQTRNIDDAAPFTAAQDPGSENFSDDFSANGNLLLESNGGGNDYNSTFDNTDETAFDWVNIDTNDNTGLVGDDTSHGFLTFTPQNTGASANEEGVKLKRSLSLGATNLNMEDYLFRTKPGGRYKLRINAKRHTSADTDIYYVKFVFDDATSYTSAAITLRDSYEDLDFNFVIPANTNLDEIQFYGLDPSNTHPFYIQTASLFELISSDRTGWGQSIGDYDVLVYHVTGCCHIDNDIQAYRQDGNSSTNSGYYTTGELSGYPSTTDSTWAKYIDHPGCQNFVKWTLISRHNNSYDNQTWDTAVKHPDLAGVSSDDKGIYIFDRSGNAENYYNYGALNTGIAAGDNYPQSMIEQDEYLMVDSASTTSTAMSQGLNLRRKQIYSTASASHVVQPSLDQSTSTVGRDMRSGLAHTGTVEDLGANKYFSPVHRVDIYASHKFILTDQTLGASTQTHTTYGTLVRVSSHDTTFWQLVVNVKLLAFNFSAGIDESRDYEFFKSRINVHYQPVGETQNIIFSTTSHTT